MILRELTDQVKIENIAGDQINPASNEKLDELKTILDLIDQNTDTLEDKTQSIRNQLDVLLSTRASESTSQEILNTLGEESGTNILYELQNLTFDTSDLAKEATLIEVRDSLDTVETKLQTLIDRLDVNLSTRASESTLASVLTELENIEGKDFATESTSQEILNTIGQESGSTIFSKLDILDDSLHDLITPFPGIAISEFLVNGTSRKMNIDGSITPVEFSIEPPSGKIWYLHSITVVIEDIGMNFNKYGGISELTNGVKFLIKQNGGIETEIANIVRNGDYYTFVNELIFDSSTSDILVGKVLIKQNTGTTMKLIGSNSEYIKAVVNDNLTGLNVHYVLIRGYEVNE